MKKYLSFFLCTLNLIVLAYFLNAQQPKLMLPVGHVKAVDKALFSPDGKLVLTTSSDGTVKVWDAYSAQLLIDLNVSDGLYNAKFSPGGKVSLPNKPDTIIKVWDVVSGQSITNLNGHVFSPDGKYIVTISNYDIGSAPVVQLWDASTWQLIANLKGHISYVKRVVFSPDSRLIVSTSYDQTAKVWNVATGKLIANLEGFSIASFSPDGKSIVTALGIKAQVWDAGTGKLRVNLKGHASIKRYGEVRDTHINTAVFSPDGKWILTASSDHTAKVWNARTGKLVANLKHLSNVNGGVFSPDGKRIVTFDGMYAQVWNTATWQRVVEFDGHSGDVSNAVFSPDGKLIVTASGDKTAKVWEAATGRMISNLKGHTDYILDAGFSPDGSLIVTALEGKPVKVSGAATGKFIAELQGMTNWILSSPFSADGKFLLTTSATRDIKWQKDQHGNQIGIGGRLDASASVWNTSTWQLVAKLTGHTGHIKIAVFSPDSKSIFTASDDDASTDSDDETAKVWNTASGHLVADLKGNTRMRESAVFSPDGKLIATASYAPYGNTAKVWNAATGQLVYDLIGHRGDVNNVLFSPDGKLIVTTSEDNTAKIWDVANGKLKADLIAHTNIFSRVVFSPDGKLVVTTSWDSTARIWNVGTGRLVANLIDNRGVIRILCSPDGKWIITIGPQNAKMWNAANFTSVHTVQAEENDNFRDFNFSNNRLVSVDNSKIGVYDIKSGKKLFSKVDIDSSDYLNYIPSGYYMSTPNAAKLLHYVTKDLKGITFAQLDIKYNRPDKVLEAMGYPDTALINSYRNVYYKRIKKLGIDTTAFREDYSVPEADFTNRDSINNDQTNETLQLHIHGKDSIYLLDRFNVWVNEVPLFGVRGINIKYRNDNSFDTSFTIALSQGSNQIETSITNVNGTESYRMPFLVRYTPQQPKREKAYFIGIGINRFADHNYNLQWSVKDIRDLAVKLKEKYKDNIEIDTLFDENVTVENVTALKKKLARSSINDKVIVAYSGHGLLSSDYDYYLSTYSVNFSHPEQNGLPYDELDNLLDNIPARKKLMLIDACHSGEVDKEEMQQYKEVKNKLDSIGIGKGVVLINKDSSKVGMKGSVELMQELFVNVGKSTGATIISAAAGTQFALEKSNLKNGVFTYSLLEYMQQHEHATVNDLKRYVNQRVTELTAGMQVPTTRNENIQLNWEVW